MSVHVNAILRIVASYIQRRNKGPRWLPAARRRVYNVLYDDGFGYSVSLQDLDRLLDAGRFPADFSTCVAAADEAFESGDRDAVFEWPSGRRLPKRPSGDLTE